LERHGRRSATSCYGWEPRNRLVPSSGEASGKCLAGRELRRSPSASPGARNACASIGQDQIARPSRDGESASRDPQGHHRNGRSLDDLFRDAVEVHASPTLFPRMLMTMRLARSSMAILRISSATLLTTTRVRRRSASTGGSKALRNPLAREDASSHLLSSGDGKSRVIVLQHRNMFKLPGAEGAAMLGTCEPSAGQNRCQRYGGGLAES
jgi:hypothetical protein